MSSAKTKLVILATAFGIGLAGLVHRCDERLSRMSGETVPDTDTGVKNSPSGALPLGPKRIVVLSSAAVELLFAMGAGDRIVGVTRYAVYPPAVSTLPRLGGIMDLNFERLTELNPDLIIVQSANPKIEAFARRRGIEFLPIEMERIEDVLRLAETLGEKLALKKEGRALAADIRLGLESVRRQVSGRHGIACFISVDRTPGKLSQLLSTGKETFLSEMVELAGGRNVFGDMDAPYRTVSKEALVARSPEVILEFKPGEDTASDTVTSMMADWQLLDVLPAVRHGRIHLVTHDAALLPGPRMTEVAEALARMLHPSAFEEEDSDKAR